MDIKLKSLTIFFILLCSSIQIQAMGTLRKDCDLTIEQWNNYIENGGTVHQYPLWADVMRPHVHILMLNKMNTLDEIIATPSTLQAAQQIRTLSASEFDIRYANYKKVFDSFIDLLIIKQHAENILEKYPPETLSAHLSHLPSTYLPQVDQRLKATSKWLNAIRNSREEFYLGLRRFGDLSSQLTPQSLWHSTMEDDVLLNLKECYHNQNSHFGASSMAILRTQLREGFDEQYVDR